MHPILFRIPLPQRAVPLMWLAIALAAVALAFAITYLARKNRQSAGIAAGIAVAAGAGAFVLKSQPPWDMGPIPIYSYGVMLGLSLVVGWYLTLTLAERDGLPKETMANCYVVTAVVAVVGSRVLYILTNLNEFQTVGSLFAMRRGGLVAYGGFLGGLLGSFMFLRQHKIPLLPWADVAVPSLASGLMITRIGCYLFGCDFGQPLKPGAPAFLQKLGSFPHWAEGTLDNGSTGSPAWVQHHNARLIGDDAAYSLPVHPTQIYESLVGLSLLALLLWARKKQKFRGQIFFLFAFAYGVCRYLLEILRDDNERGSLPFSMPEHILYPLGLAVLAVGYLIGFSQWVKNLQVRRVTQVLAFVPVVALFFLLKPEGFETNAEFSTSQFIAITTGFAAAVAFAIFHKAALAHPEAAMDLRLPGAPLPKGADDGEDEDDDEDDEDDDEEEEAPKAKKPAPKPVVKAQKAAPAKKAPAKVVKGKAKPKAKPAPKKDEETDEPEEKAEAAAEPEGDAEKKPEADDAPKAEAKAKAKAEVLSKSDDDGEKKADEKAPEKAEAEEE
jgi:phosphatidylglycerol---prolipoprotein diacylglyceryl transferase